VTLRTALASSLNVPAVRTQLLLPPDAFAARLRELGFDGVRDGEEHGAALALGAADVTLHQLVSAYRTLANGGVAGPLTLLPRETPAREKGILSPGASFIVSDILADRGAREATFGLESLLSTPFRAAVKTGTSKDMRDNWCVGFTREYTVGVWVGNFRGDPMWNVSGISGAAPVWAEIMGELHRGRAGSFPSPPPGIVPRRVTFPGEIEGDRTEWFLAGTEPSRTAPAGATRGIARIRYPSDGTVVALDPDIPPGRQRLFLEAAGGDAAHTLVLDGAPLGAADRMLPWRPHPGAHTLTLVDGDGTVVDTVAFSVRGTPIAGR
jgi:penicillin-binding protein 1C